MRLDISQAITVITLLINTAYVSYGSPYLKRLQSHSVDFLIFCEFLNFDFNISMCCDISKGVTTINF